MSGFAPLIEGFLAFALTMLALTMGVSAIVGALHYARRSRGRGLRAMVRLLYQREIQRLLPPEEKGGTPADDAAARRAEFIFDMTFMPVPAIVEKLQTETQGRDYWCGKVVSAERLVGLPWYLTVFHPKRLGRRWRTLRYSLEVLSDNEFTERLVSSSVGKALTAEQAWGRRGFGGWDELSAHLLKQFKTLGSAASENFARQSRVMSVAVGFLLVLLLNVDSLDLLNSFLTDPELRQRVIERSDAITSGDRPSTQTTGKTTGDTPAVASAAASVAGAARDLRGVVEALNASASDTRRLSPDMQARLQQAVSKAREVEAGATEFGETVSDAERRIRAVTVSLASSFPIGWTRFPNCAMSESPDLRCAGRVFRLAADSKGPWWYQASAWLNLTLPGSIWAQGHSHVSILAAAYTVDPAALQQWCIGVFITGLLLGLGSPFWVQAVSAAFNLRRWVKDDSTATASAATATGDKAK